MTAKTSKLPHVNLITKILLILIILNIAGDVFSAYWFLSTPSLGELSLFSGLIASFAGQNIALVIVNAVLLTYASVYAIAAYGLFRKTNWAPLLIIAVSIVNRALALIIFVPNHQWLIWTAWQIMIISLAFILWRKTKFSS